MIWTHHSNLAFSIQVFTRTCKSLDGTDTCRHRGKYGVSIQKFTKYDDHAKPHEMDFYFIGNHASYQFQSISLK